MQLVIGFRLQEAQCYRDRPDSTHLRVGGHRLLHVWQTAQLAQNVGLRRFAGRRRMQSAERVQKRISVLRLAVQRPAAVQLRESAATKVRDFTSQSSFPLWGNTIETQTLPLHNILRLVRLEYGLGLRLLVVAKQS